MKNIANRTFAKIKGQIKATEKDKSGNVVQVAIETNEFESYIIADNHKGKELLNIIDKNVLAKGYIAGEYFDGREILFVNNYEII